MKPHDCIEEGCVKEHRDGYILLAALEKIGMPSMRQVSYEHYPDWQRCPECKVKRFAHEDNCSYTRRVETVSHTLEWVLKRVGLKGQSVRESPSIEDVPWPICPMGFFFEGDEEMCDREKCGYVMEVRSCNMECTTEKYEWTEKARRLKEITFNLSALYRAAVVYETLGEPDDQIAKIANFLEGQLVDELKKLTEAK